MKKIYAFIGAVLMTSTFSVNAQVFTEDFTAPQAGWTIMQLDADTNYWFIASFSTGALTGQGNMAMSQSWIQAGPLNPDNLLISPVIDASALTGTLSLSFKAGSPETTASGWYEEYLSVYVTDGFNGLATAMASPIHAAALTAGETMLPFTYDISSMVGADSLMLVFRHHNCTDENILGLDDINVNNVAGIGEEMISTNVYPNPATDVLNIQVAEEIELVEVVTLDGKVVATSTSSKVDVADLTAGMYIYRVRTTSGGFAAGNFAKK